MPATATVTRRVTMTMPRRVSDILDRKAERDSVPLSKAILAVIEDALDDDDPISEAEERRLVARAEKNEAESSRLYTHEEVFAKTDSSCSASRDADVRRRA